MSDEKVISCTSGCNKEGEPFVTVYVNKEKVISMEPNEARHFAMNVLSAAEASEQDAFLVDFMQHKVGADLKAAAGVLVDYRKWREERMKFKDTKDGQKRIV